MKQCVPESVQMSYVLKTHGLCNASGATIRCRDSSFIRFLFHCSIKPIPDIRLSSPNVSCAAVNSTQGAPGLDQVASIDNYHYRKARILDVKKP